MILSKRYKASGRGSFRKERPRMSESISNPGSVVVGVLKPLPERAALEWHP